MMCYVPQEALGGVPLKDLVDSTHFSVSIMNKGTSRGCALIEESARAQWPWRRFSRHLVLPEQSSRARGRRRQTFPRKKRWKDEEKEQKSESSSDGICSSDHDVPFRVKERLTCTGCNKRRPSFSDTESVLNMMKMPVSTTNSVLKSSFSLTSLRSSNNPDSAEHGTTVRLNAERPYHSLTKKSRQNGCRDRNEKEQWRKSWGSGISQDGKEFWEGFQADYDYLMAQNMLERDVGEGGADRGAPGAPPVWSHSEFMDHFAQLYSWLRGIQEAVRKEENHVTDWKSRAERLEEMQRQRGRVERFREESIRVVGRWPEWEGEVAGRVRRIGEEWERAEAMMRGGREGEGEGKEEAEGETRFLRRWLREVDKKLKPLSFQRGWTKSELEAMIKEHMILHRDIKAHGKNLSSLLKLCERIESPKCLASARALERKYYLYYLRSLEWQYHLESLSGQHNKGSSNATNESDGEPVPKIARFTWPEEGYESEENEESESLKSDEVCWKDNDCGMDISVKDELVCPPTTQSAKSTAMGAQKPRGPSGLGGRKLVFGAESRNVEAALNCVNPSAAHSDDDPQHRQRGMSAAPELQMINRTKEKPPNTGVFTLRHLDTDSEQEKLTSKDAPKTDSPATQDADTTSSEGEWTYRSSAKVTGAEGSTEKSRAVVRLNFENEETKPMKHFSAKNIPPMSGQELISSSKLVEIADELFRCKKGRVRKSRRERTLRRKDLDSCDASGENTDEEGAARRRPLSMSGVSWLRTPRNHGCKSRASVSESALHQMTEYWSTFGRGNGMMGCGEEGSSGSVKKKRSRIRKLTRKSESGSDGPTLSGSDSSFCPGRKMATLVKSGSFSGVSRRQRGEGATGSETEEDAQRLMAPRFRLGPSGGAVTVAVEQDKVQVEEQHSLNWDSYQEKYQSEAFSEEPVDSDTAKKLLEFGEDYGKFFGNQSDSASAGHLSFGGCGRCMADSDSDVNDVRQKLRQSLEHLRLWEMKFNRKIGGLLSGSDVAEDECVHKTFLDEVVGACKRNVECLTKLLVEVKDEMFLAKEHEVLQDVKDRWESLKCQAELHKCKQLQSEMAALRDELRGLAARADASEATVVSREELEAKITQVQNELNLMKKGKNRLLQANVSVHRFLASAKHADSALKEEVTELYQLWEQTFCRVSAHLSNLQNLSQTWHDFEDHLAQLQCALRTDTLKVLDFALKRGASSGGEAPSLQDIAGILARRGCESKGPLVMSEAEGKAAVPALGALSTEGSLSDSGISDSGSERELGEREKRLAQLKRLAKRLETILAPGSEALSNMFRRIEQAESELRELQKTCRDLIVRSASTEEIRMFVASTSTLGDLDLEKSVSAPCALQAPAPPRAEKQSKSLADSGKEAASPPDCGETKPAKKFWLWRLLCYALPFHLAFVAVLCLAAMLEPRCCDSLNNLDRSLHPQIRYDSGPPPV